MGRYRNGSAVGMEEADQIEFRMNEIIDLRHIEDCRDIDEWVDEVSKIINDTEEDDMQIEIARSDIEVFIDSKMRDGELIWSERTGALIAI